MYCDMLQRTLDIHVGQDIGSMSRHVSAAGTRFRLLNCGMSLLQGDVLPKSLAKHVLRQRIYSCSLDFFCADKMYPVRSGPSLKEDVQVLLKFWSMMLSDKKYIKTQIVGDGPITLGDTLWPKDLAQTMGSWAGSRRQSRAGNSNPALGAGLHLERILIVEW